MAEIPPASAGAPQRPRLVLRAGFAGRKDLSDPERAPLAEKLLDVLQTLGHRLAAIAPGTPIERGREPHVSQYFDQQCPLLRLVTGLCEGADAVAAEVICKVEISTDDGAVEHTGCVTGAAAASASNTASEAAKTTVCLNTELAAVLPFDIETYRRSRPADYQEDFDKHLKRCAYVLALDGIYEKPPGDSERAKYRRGRAYRAQSAFLLRHSDVLIAAADPSDPGKAGGTLETVRNALDFDIPVIFIHTGSGLIYTIEPHDDLYANLGESAPEDWKARVRDWVTHLVVDAEGRGKSPRPHESDSHHARETGLPLLHEFFDDASCPPQEISSERRITPLEQQWSDFYEYFKTNPCRSPPPVQGRASAALEPFATYRRRASELNYHYAGRYRGAFLLNYRLAVAAVGLAAFSLVLLVLLALLEPHGGKGSGAGQQAMNGGASHVTPPEHAASAPDDAAAHDSCLGTPLIWILSAALLLFVTSKLILLSIIAYNTHRANDQQWNDRAVNYRYLSERLRSMFYLPRAGSHQPPAVTSPPQFASRVVKQSEADWLFDAIVRAVSPAEMPHATPTQIPSIKNTGETVAVRKLLTLQPRSVTEMLAHEWMGQQITYHKDNTCAMERITTWAKESAETLTILVIAAVVIDLIVVLLFDVLRLRPEGWESPVHFLAPWLVAVTAILPAIIAALSGLRFQSECDRLGERSALMHVMLAGRDGAPGWQQLAEDLRAKIPLPPGPGGAPANNDSGSWAHPTLRLAESVDRLFIQEVSEWSVLYAKELNEPG